MSLHFRFIQGENETELPPKGYRLMESDEIIQQGDVFFGADPPDDPAKIHRALSIGYTPGHSFHGYLYFRKIESDKVTK